MAKEFITERDIEDMVKRGILSLEMNDNVVLTDLAYEKANRLGMRLVRDKPENPPGAPVRPYLAQKSPALQARPLSAQSASSSSTPVLAPVNAVLTPQPDGEDLHQRIRSAVISRMGGQVDGKLLDVIIRRVLQSTGVK
jgi:hypothetical protein